MEAVVTKGEYSNTSKLVALVWEDDELDKMYFIPGIPNYSRTTWNLEKPAREAFQKEIDKVWNKIMWKK